MRNQTLALLAGLALSGAAQAALIDRGGGMIYDDVLDITWLQNANLFKTQYDADNNVVNQIIAAVPTITDSLGTHNVVAGDFTTSTGRMTWWGAMAWAQWLDFGGHDDWRLPMLVPINGTAFQTGFSNNATTDWGYAKTTTDGTDGGWRDGAGVPVSEMGHMYYVNLGNLGFCTPEDAEPTDCDIQTGWGLSNTGLFTNLQSYVYWSGLEYAPFTGSAWGFGTYFGLQDAYNKDDGDVYAWAVRPGDVAGAPEPATLGLLGLGLAGLGWARGRRRG